MSSQSNAAAPPNPWLRVIGLLVVATSSSFLGYWLVVGDDGPGFSSFSGSTSSSDASPTDATSSSDGGAEGGLATKTTSPAEDLGIPVIDGRTIRPTPPLSMGDRYYWKCYPSGETKALLEDACPPMRPFERLFTSKLGALTRCYQRLDERETGTLSLAVDVDFGEPTKTGEETSGPREAKLKFWSGRSTTIENHDALISCLNNRLGKVDFRGDRHDMQRYVMFFPIEFEEPSSEGGTPVELVLDRVRLRREPVKGKVVARLAQGEPIRVFEIENDWARVKTLDGREGWLFAEAITVTDP